MGKPLQNLAGSPLPAESLHLRKRDDFLGAAECHNIFSRKTDPFPLIPRVVAVFKKIPFSIF